MLARVIWVKVFKNGPSKIFGRQPLKKFEVTWHFPLNHQKPINFSDDIRGDRS